VKLRLSDGRTCAQVTADGVLVISFAGFLSAARLRQEKSAVVDAMAVRPRAVVADYRAAVLALSGSELQQIMDGQSPEDLPGLPAAVVPSVGMASAMADAALSSAVRLGVWRLVHPGQDPALASVRRALDLAGLARGTRQP
jgi:hypothetical protein